MNWINRNNILQAIFIFSFLFANNNTNGDEQLSKIELSIYEGQGSVLLEWSMPNHIKPVVTRIFVQFSRDDDFQLLAKLDNNVSKFLHKDCLVGYRYFYYLEVEDDFGSIFSSDLETPVFASCLALKDSSELNPSIKNIDDLIISEISKKALLIDSDEDYSDLINLLKLDNHNSENIWLENYPTNRLTEIEPYFILLNNILMIDSFENSIISLESLFRNRFYLNPTEWMIQINKRIIIIQERLKLLINTYPLAVEKLNDLAPIRIIGFEYLDSQKKIYLYKFHPEKINLRETVLLSGDEYFDFKEYEFEDEDKQLLSIQIPDHWVTIDLFTEDIFIQNCNLNILQSVSFTLDGEIIPSDSPSRIIVKKKSENLWLNEIAWNSNQYQLHIEIAGIIDFNNFYSVYLNEEKFWDINLNPEFEIQYSDSLFFLNTELQLPITLSFNKELPDYTETIEIIILDSSSFGIMRFNNESYWTNMELSTFGKPNNIDNQDPEIDLLPELFVLYQNYPNPFNGATRITFDLLDDAVVSLYITDATGRIHDKFLIDEPLNSGTYNFNWNGEGRSTGIYFFTIQAQVENFLPAILSRKMIYLK